MRVTNSMLTSNFLNNLNTNLNKLDKLQTQLAKNRKYAHISDDPVSVIYSQQARYKLNRVTHYKKNVETAQSWLVQVEEGIMDINEIIKSAYEATIDAATDVKSPEDRKNASEYIKQLRDQLVQSLNTTFGDKFIFGGYNTTGKATGETHIPPFTVITNEEGKEELCFNGEEIKELDLESFKKDVLTFDVGIGSEIQVTFSGLDLAVYDDEGNNVYDLLNDLYTDLLNGESAEVIGSHTEKLQTAQSHMLAMAAEIGGRTNRLNILSTRYEKDEINYTQMMSNAEDADQAEVIMHFMMAKSVYNAALSTGSYVIMPTLMDFLN